MLRFVLKEFSFLRCGRRNCIHKRFRIVFHVLQDLLPFLLSTHSLFNLSFLFLLILHVSILDIDQILIHQVLSTLIVIDKLICLCHVNQTSFQFLTLTEYRSIQRLKIIWYSLGSFIRFYAFEKVHHLCCIVIFSWFVQILRWLLLILAMVEIYIWVQHWLVLLFLLKSFIRICVVICLIWACEIFWRACLPVLSFKQNMLLSLLDLIVRRSSIVRREYLSLFVLRILHKDWYGSFAYLVSSWISIWIYGWSTWTSTFCFWIQFYCVSWTWSTFLFVILPILWSWFWLRLWFWFVNRLFLCLLLLRLLFHIIESFFSASWLMHSLRFLNTCSFLF